MTRLEDWPARLDQALRAAHRTPFAWGEFDCCLFAADVVDAICGSAIAAKFRGRYKTSRGARGFLKRAGGIDGLMAGIGTDIPVLMAQRGDVVALPGEDLTMAQADASEGAGLMLGICIGDSIAGLSMKGVFLVPLALGRRAWRIGA